MKTLRHVASSVVLAGLFAAACGTTSSGTDAANDSGSNGAAATGITFSGSARSLVVPTSIQATPTFAGIAAQVAGFEDLANPNVTDVPALASVDVQAAASSCMGTGCSFHVGGVDLTGVSHAAFVKLSCNSALAAGKWQDAYTMVANSNAIDTSKRNNGPLDSFAPATLPTTATVANLASLAGITQDELLARGATLAYVSGSRSSGDTRGTGLSGAYVSLTAAQDGVLVVYPDANYQRVANNGTNADGAVLLVGPPAGAAAPASYAHAVTVKAAGSGLTFNDNAVLLRPNTLVLLTLLPTR